MPWVTLGVAAVGLIGGVISGNKADKASRQQARIAQQQLDLSREQQQFGRQQYADWRNTFFPLGSQIVNASQEALNPDYGQISADIEGQYEGIRGGEQRRMERYGIAPDSGASRAMAMRLGRD